MTIRTRDIGTLLNTLSTVTKQPLDYTGLKAMAELIEEKSPVKNVIGETYIYEKVYRPWKEAKGIGSTAIVGIRVSKLDVIARFIGHSSYQEFVEEINREVDPILRSCEGAYYSYVRMNHKNSTLLRSPVEIKNEAGKVLWRLIGPERTYEGELSQAGGCIYVLMTSSDGKQFHHVYRIGKKSSPKVLLGIFSGVSTAFVPIAGRAVLIRSDERIELLSQKQLNVGDLRKSKVLAERRLAEFFKDYSVNNLKVPEQMTYNVNDLGSCK